jgi:hypothetical protein
MYLDSSPVPARRSAEIRRRRGACSDPTRQAAIATSSVTAGRPRAENAAARRSRLDDAIVSQWLLDQVPSDHRHALGGASNRYGLAS